jgi:hypothetical protein
MDLPAWADLLAFFITPSALMILGAIAMGSALSGASAKRLKESGAAGKARLVTVLGAALAALVPCAGVVLAVIVAGPPPVGRGHVGTLVALVAIVAGYVGLFIATRLWPVAFKIVVVVTYTLFLGWSLFNFALILACGLYRACV